ncbi:hypothetical protein SDC9_136906 [bioreactor metagenome]|uniref:Uncharacterized protein n=1 Tax=bioreactor metagenome TaxID=1076179 RepID=A0A645DK21_9ZZZZ
MQSRHGNPVPLHLIDEIAVGLDVFLQCIAFNPVPVEGFHHRQALNKFQYRGDQLTFNPAVVVGMAQGPSLHPGNSGKKEQHPQ